jgi:DNA-directed RNA polymerase subunit RPC12/RpoP
VANDDGCPDLPAKRRVAAAITFGATPATMVEQGRLGDRDRDEGQAVLRARHTCANKLVRWSGARATSEPLVRRRLLLSLLLILAFLLGNNLGWKYVFAPMLGWAFISWAFASMRSMASGGTPSAVEGSNEPERVSPRERVLYWCEECGTELLLLIRGSGTNPRHCGTKMHERAEVLGEA